MWTTYLTGPFLNAQGTEFRIKSAFDKILQNEVPSLISGMYSDHKNIMQQQKIPFLYEYYVNLISNNIFWHERCSTSERPSSSVVAACFGQRRVGVPSLVFISKWL